MSYESPTPSAELPSDVVKTLDGYSPDILRHVANYAEELAEYRDQEARLADESDEEEIQDHPDELPDEVPPKATTTIKEINDNRYHYWQWREGEKVKSKYKGPVTPSK